VLGPEKGALSPALVARSDHLVRIPMRFCVNVGVAGAIVMYDRLITTGRHARRPTGSRGRPEAPTEHVQGGPVVRRGGGKGGSRSD
jgi:hypothetical protein